MNLFHHRLPSILRQIRKIKRSKVEAKYYAVAVGRRVGIYRSWPSAKVQIDGIVNAKYKSFLTAAEAMKFVDQNSGEQLIIAQEYGEKSTDVKSDFCYIDGSCWKNGTKEASAGIGVHWPGHPQDNLSVPLDADRHHTNIRAEIWAAITAIRQAHRFKIAHLTIYTDSHFVIQAAVRWLPHWKRNGWRNWKGQSVKNRDDLEKLDDAMRFVSKIVWKHVVAHSGIVGNEAADRLANKAIDKSVTTNANPNAKATKKVRVKKDAND